MKRNDELQNFADRTLSECDNPEIKNELKSVAADTFEETSRAKRSPIFKNKKMIRIVSAAASIIIMAIVALSVIFIPSNNAKPDDDKDYSFGINDGIMSKKSDMESVGNDVDNFEFDLDDVNYDVDVTKYLYRESGETVYYRILVIIDEDTGMEMEIFVVTNKNYTRFDYNFDYNFDKTVKIGQYDLMYKETIELLDEDFEAYYQEAKGKIETDAEKLYFTCSGASYENTGVFAEYVRSFIKTK